MTCQKGAHPAEPVGSPPASKIGRAVRKPFVFENKDAEFLFFAPRTHQLMRAPNVEGKGSEPPRRIQAAGKSLKRFQPRESHFLANLGTTICAADGAVSNQPRFFPGACTTPSFPAATLGPHRARASAAPPGTRKRCPASTSFCKSSRVNEGSPRAEDQGIV